jgi:uncharacterized cupredoxin-like copper-binding protein
VAVVAFISVSVSGCTSSEGGRDGRSDTFTVVGTEMAFDAPDRVTGGDYTVVFRNAGTVYHELAFRDPAGKFIARRSIPAHQSVTMDVSLETGTYELGCFEPGHYEAGMHRPLVVSSAS